MDDCDCDYAEQQTQEKLKAAISFEEGIVLFARQERTHELRTSFLSER